MYILAFIIFSINLLLLAFSNVLGGIDKSISASTYCDRCYRAYVQQSVTLEHPAKAVGRKRCYLTETLKWSRVTLFCTEAPVPSRRHFGSQPPVHSNAPMAYRQITLALVFM